MLGTILLPNFNNERVLPFTFAAMRRTLDCERLRLIVVDDGSEDDGVRVIKEESVHCGFASVELLECAHRGVVSAVNEGIRATKTPLVFRIDGDALVQTPDWTTRMARCLSHSQIGLVAGHTIFDSGLLHSRGRQVVVESGLHDLGTCPCEPAGLRTLDSNVWRPPCSFRDGELYETDSALATCIGFRLDDALEVGLFDTRFDPVWIEDDDFGLALRKLGRKVVIDPNIHILHRTSLRDPREPGMLQTYEASDTGLRREKMRRQIARWIRLVEHLVQPREIEFGSGGSRVFFGGSDWQINILLKHYQNWQEKWGFNPLNPSMESIFNSYYDGEICWRYNRDLYVKGRRLLATVQQDL